MAHITRGQRWLARLASAAAAAAVRLVLAGAPRGLTALLVGLAGLAVVCAVAWWFLAHRGVLRWLAFALLAVAPVVVIVVYAVAGLLWEVGLSVVLAAAAVAAGRAALRRAGPPASPREYTSVPQQRAFVIMNPRSGGGRSRSSGCPARPSSPVPWWPCSKVRP